MSAATLVLPFQLFDSDPGKMRALSDLLDKSEQEWSKTAIPFEPSTSAKRTSK